MRRSPLAFLLCAALFAPRLFAAEQVVLKDGRTIALAKPYTVKGKTAILTRSDKTVLAIPLSEIDLEKTALARSKPAPAPTAIKRPLTPAEAAQVKSTKKAVVTVNDDSIAHPAQNAEPGRPAAEGGGHVELGSINVQKGKNGYTVTGSLSNTGKADVQAVALTVEAIGAENKTLASGFANVAKDTLAPGEKTTFTAEIQTDQTAASFNYVPRWKEKAPGNVSVASGTTGAQAPPPPNNPLATPPPEADVAPTGRATDERARPTPIPRGDVASPPQSAPVGQPTEPGGTYLPQPSNEGQPHPPQS